MAVVTTMSNKGNGTSITVLCPASANVGDTALVEVGFANNPTGATISAAAITGATILANNTTDSTYGHSLLYKIPIIAGMPGNNFTWTLSAGRQWAVVGTVLNGLDFSVIDASNNGYKSAGVEPTNNWPRTNSITGSLTTPNPDEVFIFVVGYGNGVTLGQFTAPTQNDWTKIAGIDANSTYAPAAAIGKFNTDPTTAGMALANRTWSQTAPMSAMTYHIIAYKVVNNGVTINAPAAKAGARSGTNPQEVSSEQLLLALPASAAASGGDATEIYVTAYTELGLQWAITDNPVKTLTAMWKSYGPVVTSWFGPQNWYSGIAWNGNNSGQVTKTISFQWQAVLFATQTVSLQWRYLNKLATTKQFVWQAGGKVTTTTSFQWAQGGTISDSLNAIWNITLPASKTIEFDWNYRTLITTNTKQYIWNARAVVTKTDTPLWNTLSFITPINASKTISAVWNALAYTSTSRQILFNQRQSMLVNPYFYWRTGGQITAVTKSLVWNTLGAIRVDPNFWWNHAGSITVDVGVLFGVYSSIAMVQTYRWNLAVPGPTITKQVLWRDYSAVEKDLYLWWNTDKGVSRWTEITIQKTTWQEIVV